MCPCLFFFRVHDYWFGYKMLCYAYYARSVEHEAVFRDSKLGWLPSVISQFGFTSRRKLQVFWFLGYCGQPLCNWVQGDPTVVGSVQVRSC